MKKVITEDMDLQKEWMEQAKDMTVEKLPEFIRSLSEDYEHDYGTICHACAAAAVAAACAVEKSPSGGITGAQGNFIMWQFMRGWNPNMLGVCGARVLRYEDLLFPQYVEKYHKIPKAVWEKLQERANHHLDTADTELVAAEVLDHWNAIAAGKVPEGWTVKGNDE